MSGVVYPCAACKIQRKKCGDKCVLAPYFPPNDPDKFVVVHKLFRTSKIVKILQSIPGEKRADAVASMVYEANVRRSDPVYGCAGTVCQLQKQISYLESQLAATKADLLNAQANLVSLKTGFCNAGEAGNILGVNHNMVQHKDDLNFWQDDENLFGLRESL